MLLDKPYFTLNVDSYLCIGYVLMNGQLMYAAEMSPVRFDQPVNHWIRKGRNELTLMLMPFDEDGNQMFPKGARCEATLSVRRSGTSPDDKVAIASLKFQADDETYIGGNSPAANLDSKKRFVPGQKGDVKTGEAQKESFHDVGLILRRTVSLPKIGLPEWKFLGSDDITDLSGADIEGQLDEGTYEGLKTELLPVYRNIWSALESGDVDGILPLYGERNKEIDAAFFKEPGETGRRMGEELKERIADDKCELWPITDNNVMFRLSDNNKLACLVQNNDKPLLCFNVPDAGMAYYYDAIFRKSGGEWILTR